MFKVSRAEMGSQVYLIWNNMLLEFFFLILFYFLTLQYCIGFSMYQNESATGIYKGTPNS